MFAQVAVSSPLGFCSQFHSTHYSLPTVSLDDNTHHGISDSMTLYRCGAMRWVAAPEGRRTGARDVPRADGNNRLEYEPRLWDTTLRSAARHGMSTTTRSRYWGGVCRDLAKAGHG